MKKVIVTVGLAAVLGSQLVAPQTKITNNNNRVTDHTPIVAQRQVAPTTNSNVQEAIATPTPTATPEAAEVTAPPEEPSSSDPVGLGQQMAASRGWTGYEWNALYVLWERESGWNPYAYNQSSGACNIPQALPCSKIPDHSVQGQIQWGLDYITSRYGDPANAWYHEEVYGWY